MTVNAITVTMHGDDITMVRERMSVEELVKRIMKEVCDQVSDDRHRQGICKQWQDIECTGWRKGSRSMSINVTSVTSRRSWDLGHANPVATPCLA